MNEKEIRLKAVGIRWRQAVDAWERARERCAEQSLSAHNAGIPYVEMLPDKRERDRVQYWRSKYRVSGGGAPASIEDVRAALRRALLSETIKDETRADMHAAWRETGNPDRTKISKLPSPTTDPATVADAGGLVLSRFEIERPVRLLGVRVVLDQPSEGPTGRQG